MTQTSSLLQFLEHQRAEYEATLASSVAAMDALWDAARAGEGRQQQLFALEFLAHSIAGSALAFGLVAAGEAARELELALRPDATGQRPWSPALERTAARLLDRLRAEASGAACGEGVLP